MSLLSLIGSVCVRVGLPRPNAAFTSVDPQVQQVVELASEEGQELAARHPWQALTREATFTTVAAEVQGTIQGMTGPDFKYVINDTIWNRSLRRPVFGPKSPADWQNLKAQFVNGPWNQYRIRGNQVLFTPQPGAGEDCYFEWQSSYWCVGLSGSPYADSWGADSDTSLLDERIMALGTIWRWKAAKGLEYAEDFLKYERDVQDAMARDGGKPKLNLGGGGGGDLWPVVVVPAGNWSLP
jgi:hypothetical protein